MADEMTLRSVGLELLSKACEFDVGTFPIINGKLTDELVADGIKISRSEHVFISFRGDNAWAIVWGRNCLGKDGEWEYEPMPSHREEDFLELYRFETPDDAYKFYQEWKVKAIQDFCLIRQ